MIIQGRFAKVNKLNIAIAVTAIAMFLYHLISTQYLLLPVRLHKNAHLGFALVLVFLTAAQGSQKKWTRSLMVLAAVLGLMAVLYMHVFDEALEDRVWYNTFFDLVIGVILMVLTLEGTRRTFGLTITIVTILVIAYPFLGQYLPEPFLCTGLPFDKWVSTLSVGNVGGIYSFLLSISANWIFLFMVFGMLLPAVGGDKFFYEIGKLVGEKMRGGPGFMAVISNAMLGAVQGGPTVAISGPFTIPLMKKAGYSADEAGAVATAASCGGGIMPPIMGVTAFAMAGFIGISYARICLMAIIPGLLYYLFVGAYVQLVASKRHLSIPPEEANLKVLLSSAPLFVVPITVILVLLIMEYSVAFVSFWAITSIVLVSLLRKKRPSLMQYFNGLVEGAKIGAGIGVVLAAVGMISEILVQSGMGIKLSAGIEVWSGGNLFVAILIIEAICVLMGMGGMVTPAYIMVAIFGAPALLKMGIDVAQSHFFIMYVTNFAFITPPVALGAMMACRLSGGNYIRTGIEAVKVAAAAFVLPIGFIYLPSLLLMPKQPINELLGIFSFLVGLLSFQIASVGYFINDRSIQERILFFVAAVLLVTYIITKVQLLFFVGLPLFILLALWRFALRRISSCASEPRA
jgi:TRAP transporter 4TM/12TM fusion protein